MSDLQPPLPQPAQNAGPIRWIPLLAILAIVIMAALRPGDAPWLQDEPMLFKTAIHANDTPSNQYGIPLPFTLAEVGLRGTRGVWYGPVPTWIYQFLLLCSHNLVAIVAARSILVNLATGLALFWLARNLGVSPWLAVVTMLSPWLLFYSRELWDNSFCIPFSAMALAAYADFILRRRIWALLLTVFCISLLILTHLMSLAIIAPIVLHLMIFERKSVRRSGLIASAGILLFMNFLAWPYWKWMSVDHPDKFVGEPGSLIGGFLFPFLGAHHLTATGFGDILDTDWFIRLGHIWPVVFGAQWLTAWLYPMVWIGIGLAFVRARKLIRNRAAAGIWEHMSFICLMTLFAQSIMDAREQISGYPHYFNATWIIFLFFVWQALNIAWLKPHKRLVAGILFIQALSCIVVIAGMVGYVIQNSGAMFMGYGTSIGNQIEAIRQEQQFDRHSPVEIQVSQWKSYEDDPKVIAMLNPPAPGEKPFRRVLIYYRGEGKDPFDAHIVVEGIPIETTRLASMP
jgi:hypothetical protein